MLLVPDITAGTGTEFEEMLVCDGSGGLSQSEGQEEYCGNPRPNRTRPLSDKRVSQPLSENACHTRPIPPHFGTTVPFSTERRFPEGLRGRQAFEFGEMAACLVNLTTNTTSGLRNPGLIRF